MYSVAVVVQLVPAGHARAQYRLISLRSSSVSGVISRRALVQKLIGLGSSFGIVKPARQVIADQ